MTADHTDVHRLLARLLGPPGPELTCEQCFDQLDHYVESQLAGADADQRVPGMRSHLDGCPTCAEDQASLRAILTADHDTLDRG